MWENEISIDEDEDSADVEEQAEAAKRPAVLEDDVEAHVWRAQS